jgi:hypothetical protein
VVARLLDCSDEHPVTAGIVPGSVSGSTPAHHRRTGSREQSHRAFLRRSRVSRARSSHSLGWSA